MKRVPESSKTFFRAVAWLLSLSIFGAVAVAPVMASPPIRVKANTYTSAGINTTSGGSNAIFISYLALKGWGTGGGVVGPTGYTGQITVVTGTAQPTAPVYQMFSATTQSSTTVLASNTSNLVVGQTVCGPGISGGVFTGTTASGSANVTAVSPTSPAPVAGETISGPNIPSGTTVSSFSGTTIVMSQNATGNATAENFVCQTTITAISVNTSITLSNTATASASVTLAGFTTSINVNMDEVGDAFLDFSPLDWGDTTMALGPLVQNTFSFVGSTGKIDVTRESQLQLLAFVSTGGVNVAQIAGQTAVASGTVTFPSGTILSGGTGANQVFTNGGNVSLDFTQSLPTAPSALTVGEAMFILDNIGGRRNTAQAGTSANITLDSGASASDGTYVQHLIKLTAGTGAGQIRTVTGYTGSSKIAVVDRAWSTNPDNTSVFLLIPYPVANVGLWGSGIVPATNVPGVPKVDIVDILGTSSAGPAGTMQVGNYASNQDPGTFVLGATASSWNVSGTIGNKINAAGGGADPLTNSLSAYMASGTVGNLFRLFSAGVDSSGRVLLQPTQSGVTIPTVTNLTNANLGGSAPSWAPLNFGVLAINGSGQVDINLNQTLNTAITGDFVGGAFVAARAQGFGKWVITGTPGTSGATLTLYAADGTTVVRTFNVATAGNRL